MKVCFYFPHFRDMFKQLSAGYHLELCLYDRIRDSTLIKVMGGPGRVARIYSRAFFFKKKFMSSLNSEFV